MNVTRLPALGLLTVLVLLAHWITLRGIPATVGLAHPATTGVLVLRAVSTGSATSNAPARPLPIAPLPLPARPRVLTPSPAAAVAPATVPPLASFPAEPGAAAHTPTTAAQRSDRRVTVAVAGSAQLLYDVTAESKGIGYRAHSELTWQNDGLHYDARLEISPLGPGARVQTSIGDITSDGLAPTRFSDKTRSEQAAHFLREQQQIVFSANAPPAALMTGAQDRLSMLFQLAAMLAGDPARFLEGTAIELQTAGTRDADNWLFTVGNTEDLDLPAGHLVGLKLTRHPQREFDQRVELWLAPALAYLPIRWRQTQANGDWIDHQLRTRADP